MTETTPARVHLGGKAYAHPDLERLLVPIDSIKPHPDNPRNGDQATITGSVRDNGLYRPAYVQRSTGHILAGNHTTAAVLALGGTQMPVIHLDVDDAEARKILLVDNRAADLGRYDEGLLLQLLRELDDADDFTGSGYDATDMQELADSLAAAESESLGDDADNRAPTTSEMLEVADVTWGEPRHQPKHGQVWSVGPHLLVIAKVSAEHHLWSGFLQLEDALFCPYPEPYITTSEAAATHRLILVQPNTYLAGHLLDKHESTHPEEPIALMPLPGDGDDQ